MTAPIRTGEIRLQGVRKTFRAYHAVSLKESLVRVARGQSLTERHTVLDGVDLHVEPGERLAIIGKNGSGKSTLFRLMSRILTPDAGTIEIGGRVSPLIEITAGLVMDLTGAENIRLNGVLLGLTRRQVEERFEEIVAFAELEEFIDTPVRYYSSGMQARLGFSVATHVDMDILLVDEALSVGDADFQKKGLQRMVKLNKDGCTVLIVSHDIETLRRFVSRIVVIDDGKVVIYKDADLCYI